MAVASTAYRVLAGAAVALGCGVSFAQTAPAAEPATGGNGIDPRVWLRLGAFHADIDTRVRIDDADLGVLGTEFTFERYGMAQRKTLPTALFGARLTDRFRLELEYFELSRSGRASLDRSIVFNGTTFPVSATLDSRFRSNVGRASLGYSFIRTPQFELGAVGGAHVTKFAMLLEGTAATAGGGTSVRREEQNATVPLPTLGVYGGYNFASSGWAITWRADVFALKHDGYDGRLLNAQGDVLYRFSPNVALGGTVRYMDYRLRSDSNHDLRGEVNYKFRGPQLFVQLGF